MKKAVLILAALLLVSSFVFAEDAGVKIGAWGRGLFIPVMGGSTIMSDATVSWGGVPRVGFTISGTSANVGFQADLTADNASVGVGDQQKIWVKPLDMLTIQIGRIYDDTLRGNASFGAWNWVRYAGMTGDDDVFARVGVTGQKNFEIAVAPIEGLYAFAALGGDNFGVGGNTTLLGNTAVTWGDVLIQGQYGAGYTIAGIGTIRAQYIGQSADIGVINAAFKVTAVDKLTVDVGTTFQMGLNDKAGKATIDLVGNIPTIALSASYGLDALTLNAMALAIIPKSGDTPFEIGVGADYGLGDGLSVAGDVRYLSKQAAAGLGAFDNGVVAGMASITKGFSNGLIGIGVELTNGNFAAGVNKTDPVKDIAWMVPVRFEYWF